MMAVAIVVYVTVNTSVLTSVQTAYAMTVHRGRGSQYRKVSVILPDAQSAPLTRQLLYTAIIRAQHRLRIVGTPDTVAAAVSQELWRASGLRARECANGSATPAES